VDTVTDQTGTLTVGVAKAVNITQAGQNAEFTFSGTDGTTHKIKLSASTIASGTLIVLGPDGTILADTGFGTTAITVPAALNASGTVTVVVDPAGTDTGTATLTLVS
jgi:hypothetical protein